MRRWLLAIIVAGAAFVGGLVALAAERGVAALLPAAAPMPTMTLTIAPPLPSPTAPPRVVVEQPTVQPTVAPTLLPSDQLSREVTRLQQQTIQQEGLLAVLRAERHLALAGEALNRNDLPNVEQELVAASAALDRAFERVSEDVKQVIDSQRGEISRIRAALYLAPEGLDERLRAMQRQLLALGTQ